MTLPVPTPRTWQVGDLAAASGSVNLNTELRDTANYLCAPPIAILRSTTGQSIPNNVLPMTTVTFDAEDVDTYNGHSTVTNTTRYTAQVAGWYHVLGHADFQANATGRRAAQLFVNGTGVRQNESPVCTAASSPTTCIVEASLYLNVGDYVELALFQTSGAALGLQNNTTPHLETMLCVFWISK